MYDAHTMEKQRQHMVQKQLVERGINDPAVLQAMETVPRHLFMPEDLWDQAYDDRALPLPEGQSISQPFIVALMAEILKFQGSERVLDVGTGSGYAAAIMSMLSAEVYSIERVPALAETAQTRLVELGYNNIHVLPGDGTYGLLEYAPYDAINIAAASPWVPLPLREQLANGGRLVIPVGGRHEQLLLRLVKKQDAIHTERFGGVRFVPLLGEHAWEN